MECWALKTSQKFVCICVVCMHVGGCKITCVDTDVLNNRHTLATLPQRGSVRGDPPRCPTSWESQMPGTDAMHPPTGEAGSLPLGGGSACGPLRVRPWEGWRVAFTPAVGEAESPVFGGQSGHTCVSSPSGPRLGS